MTRKKMSKKATYEAIVGGKRFAMQSKREKN